MLKRASIGAFVPLLLVVAPVTAADWTSSTMVGAKPILPSRFTPMGYELVPDPQSAAAPPSPFGQLGSIARASPAAEPARLQAPPATRQPVPLDRATTASIEGNATLKPREGASTWTLPLFDRRLSQQQRDADLATDLVDAITRIVPLYDPTRLEGPEDGTLLKVSSGTAVTDSVFADRWRRADEDPNVNVKVAYLAYAWQMKPAPCDAFFKNRAHGFGEPALTALAAEDCRRIADNQARGFAATLPASIVAAAVSVPVFAAPLPGSRLSSKDFWAAQRARVAAIQAHLAQRFHPFGEAAR